MTTASGLQMIDGTVGTGATPKAGQICVMHYTGWLYENGQKGKKFDSSVDRNEPFEFPIGQRRVIAGWDEGVATMKVGGKPASGRGSLQRPRPGCRRQKKFELSRATSSLPGTSSGMLITLSPACGGGSGWGLFEI